VTTNIVLVIILSARNVTRHLLGKSVGDTKMHFFRLKI